MKWKLKPISCTDEPLLNEPRRRRSKGSVMKSFRGFYYIARYLREKLPIPYIDYFCAQLEIIAAFNHPYTLWSARIYKHTQKHVARDCLHVYICGQAIWNGVRQQVNSWSKGDENQNMILGRTDALCRRLVALLICVYYVYECNIILQSI